MQRITLSWLAMAVLLASDAVYAALVTARSCTIWAGTPQKPASETVRCTLTVIDQNTITVAPTGGLAVGRPTLLLSRSAPPSADAGLTGTWSGSNYTCYDANNRLVSLIELISIVQNGTSIVATKITGDDCVPAGHVTFYGTLPAEAARAPR